MLTNERDKLVAEQQVTLDSHKRTISGLEQQLTITKETSNQEIGELTECLNVAKTELSVTREQLQSEVNKQLQEVKTYRNQVNSLEQQLASLQVKYTEAEEWHRKEQEQHLAEVARLSNDCQRETTEVARQLEQVTSECEMAKNKIEQHRLECEEFCQKLAIADEKYTSLQNTFDEKDKEFSDISNHLHQLEKTKKAISQQLAQVQLDASKQEQQLRVQVEMLSVEVEQLRSREVATAAEYQGYRNVTMQKEASLVQEVEDLKQANFLFQQTLKDTNENHLNNVTALEKKLASLQIEYTKAEDCRFKEQEQHLAEVAKLRNDYQKETAKFAKQLEQVTSECEISKNKMIEQHSMECEEFCNKLSAKEIEHNSLQNAYAKNNKEFSDISNQLQQLQKSKEMISQQLIQAKLAASRQEQQLREKVEMLSAEVKQLRSRELATAAEYQGYRNVTMLKEASLVQEVEDLKQANYLVEQKLKDTKENCHTEVIALEKKLASLQIEYTKAEDCHSKEQEQHLAEVTKLRNDYQKETGEVKQQLEQVTTESEMTKNKMVEQHRLECEELGNKLLATNNRCSTLQNTIAEKDKEFSDIYNQLQQLEKTNESISQQLTQTQLVASQQEQQLKWQVEMLSTELEQLTTKYGAHQNEMMQKENSLQQEVENLKQVNSLSSQQLKDSVNTISSLEEELKKSHLTITSLESCLQRMKDEQEETIAAHQDIIDKEVSNHKKTEVKNKQLEAELNLVKQDSLKLSQDLEQTRLCLAKKEAELAEKLSLWQQQTDQLMENNQLTVRRLGDDNCALQQKVSSQKLALQELSSKLTSTKQEHHEVTNLLEEKSKEFLQLQADYQACKKSASTLVEQKEAKVKELQSQLANNKLQSDLQLQAVMIENKELVESVDKLYSQQSLINNKMEQDCVNKFNSWEQDKHVTVEQIAKLRVETTSLSNELEGLKCTHKETMDCLNVERDKNNLLEKELQQLKVVNKAFEKENARINKLLAQQKYGPNSSSKMIVDTEQAHLQQLHSEMDQTVATQVIPSSPHEGSGRLEELMARNSLIPPHLKSCYPVELHLHGSTPRTTEQQLKRNVEKNSCFDVSPPRKRPINSRKQQQQQQSHDSPDSVRRRLSAPPTPTSRQSTMNTRNRSKLQLRSYLNEEQDENRAPSRVSDAFEISLTTDNKSQARMEERRAKVFQRMERSRKPPLPVQQSTIVASKPLHTRNTSKK